MSQMAFWPTPICGRPGRSIEDILYSGLIAIGDIFYCPAMGRRQINGESYLARFPVGTLEAITAALEEKEGVASFIRTAIERELKRRKLALLARPARPR